jgi:hypothetical protein
MGRAEGMIVGVAAITFFMMKFPVYQGISSSERATLKREPVNPQYSLRKSGIHT